MKINGERGHDEVLMWCLDCDRKTIHVERVLRCSTSVFRCQACGKDN